MTTSEVRTTNQEAVMSEPLRVGVLGARGRMGAQVTVLTVHQDENETAGLLRLADLGVKLPMLQDGRRLIAAALRVPNVMPATVLLRPDGSVAQVLPRPFTSADEIASAVNAQLGVSG